MTQPVNARRATSVVVVTRNRQSSLLNTLARLHDLPERPRIIVVDNGSDDRSRELVSANYPDVMLIEAGENLGAAGRNLGVLAATTPYVAFSDDDSWWASGALGAAAAVFERHRRLGLVAARIVVGPGEREDPLNRSMASSPLAHTDSIPGRPIIGFVACGAIVRREAFLAAGGFHPRFGVGGEETLLALDLRRFGWALAFVPDVVAHHHPSPSRDPAGRRRIETRNALWTAWLRLPAPDALRATAEVIRQSRRDRSARRGVTEAVAGLRGVLRERWVVPPAIGREWRLVQKYERVHDAIPRGRPEAGSQL